MKTIQKILQIHKKKKVYKQARVWLQPGQRQKQNLNRGNLLAQQLYHDVKEDGLTLSHQKQDLDSYDLSEESRQSSLTQSDVTSRRRWSNSVIQNKNFIFEIIIHKYRIGPMIDGKLVWLQEEDPKRRYQYCSDKFGNNYLSPCSSRTFWEAISLILCYRTMW